MVEVSARSLDTGAIRKSVSSENGEYRITGVPAGTYELTCETHGSVARVTLLKDGRFVATAPGAWVKTGIKHPVDEMLVRVNSDGSKSLTEIRIAGTARAIVLDQTDGTVHYSALQR